MDIITNQHGLNDMIVAIDQEMTPKSGKPRSEPDTLFIGGLKPSVNDQQGLAEFGRSKNWKVIYPSFDATDVASGPTGFHVVVTDGIAQTIVLTDGRLWKRDRASAAVLLFQSTKLVISISGKGQLLVRGLNRKHHDRGYGLAREAVLTRAARKPGQVPVISKIGALPVIYDSRTMHTMLACAA